jgi:hypothetical protein
MLLRGRRDAEAKAGTGCIIARGRDHRLHGTACIHEAGGRLRARDPARANALREHHGELGWPLQNDGRPLAEPNPAKTYGVPIVSERRFLEWVGKMAPEEQAKTYTTDETRRSGQIAVTPGLPRLVALQLTFRPSNNLPEVPFLRRPTLLSVRAITSPKVGLKNY